MNYIVMRRPCLMEDEGRYFVLKVCETLQEAKDYITTYTEDDKGYFKRTDCFIATEVST